MRHGLYFATTDEGVTLPVIDVTNPAFAVTATETELSLLADQFVRESSERQELPAPLREALQRSRLGRAIMDAAGTYMTGMNTYLMKVGPDLLGAGADPIDRRIAASFPAFAARLRLQDMARLLADGLLVSMTAAPERPLCFVNIAGGPGADSWNTLIHIQAERPHLLRGRAIAIAVLELDDRGPAFGARALAALLAPDGPLTGVRVEYRHISYDWSDPERLSRALDDLRTAGAICAVSSEGGLFEYGSDGAIAANLLALHAGTAADALIVGSVTRDGEPARASQRASGASTQPRTLEAFSHLVHQAGWNVQHVIERPFSYNVRLKKRQAIP